MDNTVNTCVPARVLAFYPFTQTADFEVQLEYIYNTAEEVNKIMPYPHLLGVPVHFPQGTGWSMTFPIHVGADAKVTFSQRGYDHWLYEGKAGAGLTMAGLPRAQHNRLYDLSDAFAEVGYNSLVRPIRNFNGADSEWRDSGATQRITLKANGDIEVTTGPNVTIKCTKATIDAPDTLITGNLVVKGTTTIVGATTMQGGMAASGGSGAAVSISGQMAVTGGATYTEDVVVAGVSSSKHTHPGVQSGGSSTGGPT